jgi:hypothetical protein
VSRLLTLQATEHPGNAVRIRAEAEPSGQQQELISQRCKLNHPQTINSSFSKPFQTHLDSISLIIFLFLSAQYSDCFGPIIQKRAEQCSEIKLMSRDRSVDTANFGTVLIVTLPESCIHRLGTRKDIRRGMDTIDFGPCAHIGEHSMFVRNRNKLFMILV